MSEVIRTPIIKWVERPKRTLSDRSLRGMATSALNSDPEYSPKQSKSNHAITLMPDLLQTRVYSESDVDAKTAELGEKHEADTYRRNIKGSIEETKECMRILKEHLEQMRTLLGEVDGSGQTSSSGNSEMRQTVVVAPHNRLDSIRKAYFEVRDSDGRLTGEDVLIDEAKIAFADYAHVSDDSEYPLGSFARVLSKTVKRQDELIHKGYKELRAEDPGLTQELFPEGLTQIIFATNYRYGGIDE